jgi:hypothetical protein
MRVFLFYPTYNRTWDRSLSTLTRLWAGEWDSVPNRLRVFFFHHIIQTSYEVHPVHIRGSFLWNSGLPVKLATLSTSDIAFKKAQSCTTMSP